MQAKKSEYRWARKKRMRGCGRRSMMLDKINSCCYIHRLVGLFEREHCHTISPALVTNHNYPFANLRGHEGQAILLSGTPTLKKNTVTTTRHGNEILDADSLFDDEPNANFTSTVTAPNKSTSHQCRTCRVYFTSNKKIHEHLRKDNCKYETQIAYSVTLKRPT